MSVKMMGRVWELDLDHPQAWVLMALADHADHDGRNIYPSVPLIAWKTGYSARQVQRILGSLVEIGVLLVEAEGGGRGRSTHYCFVPDGTGTKPPYHPDDGRKNGDRRSAIIGNHDTVTPYHQRNGDMAAQNHDKVSPIGPIIGDTVTPFPKRNHDILGRKGDTLSINGDITMSPEPPVTILTTTTTTRAREDDVGFGGGGGKTMVGNDVGFGDDVGNDGGEWTDDATEDDDDPIELRADLVDALIDLGVRREQADQAVGSGTVRSDRDVIACKRYIAGSTANSPAAVLWSQFLKRGDVPSAPQLDTSTVTAQQLAAARRLREESDRAARVPPDTIGLQRLAAVVGTAHGLKLVPSRKTGGMP